MAPGGDGICAQDRTCAKEITKIGNGESTKRKIRPDARLVRFIDLRDLAQLTFALGVFRREQMPPRRLCAQDFAASSDFKSFRDSFARFAASDRFRHKARKIIAAAAITNSFCLFSG
jgi:hypothetical protein